MASTYVLISSQVLGSSAASVTFSSIPSTYTDLVLNFSAKDDRSSVSDSFTLQFNTDTATNYSYTRLTGSGSAAASSNASSSAPTIAGVVVASTATANTFSSNEIYIPNYLVSANKPLSITSMNENNATAANMEAHAYLWRNTSAINQIVLKPFLGTNFVSGSSFYLYGVKNS
jgi:hypothetical protein